MTGQYRDRTVHMGTVPARCFDFVGFVFVFLFCFLESLPVPRGALVGLDSAGSGFHFSRHTWHAARSRTGGGSRGDMNHPGNGGRGGVRGGETKQNTGDKATGEPAIRKQKVANVDLLSPA